jgi:hypothetical protein
MGRRHLILYQHIHIFLPIYLLPLGKNAKTAILKFAVIYFFTYNCYEIIPFRKHLHVKQFLQRLL